MQIKIKVDDSKGALLFKNNVPEGININMPNIIVRKGFGVKDALEFIVEASKNIEFSLIGAYLASKCSDYKTKYPTDNLEINGVSIKFNNGTVDRIEIENIIKKTAE